MEFIVQVWWWIQGLPWETILIYLGSAGVIMPVTQYLKGKLNNKTKQKVFSIIGALSAFPAVIEQLANNSAWTQYLPDQFGWLFSTVILLHAFFGSPVWRRLNSTLLQYKQALDVVRSEGNIQPASPISNPNNTLNNPKVTPQKSVQPVEEKPLVISG